MLRLTLALCIALLSAPAGATEAGWALLREGGHVVVLRHAMASGAVDPPNVDPENCATQRNLTERGKQQARKIGALFAARAANADRVLSSRYCRTMETARLAFGDRDLEPFEALDPAAAGSPEAEPNKAAVMAEVANFVGSGNLVMVTHLDVIQALTGAGAREGEAIVVRADGDRLHVLARIVFN
ncbi:MAG: histidine phosphatase family protein [Rhizobiaceae bacterium]